MKLTILVDNNTLVDRYYLGEPALAFLIEADGKRILFDTGYSNLFIMNALKMNEDIKNIDHMVISHGHNDHTMGLVEYIKYIMEKKDENNQVKKANLWMHPYALIPKIDKKIGNIGMMLSEDQLQHHFNVITSKDPVHITERLMFLGEIERKHEPERIKDTRKVLIKDEEREDELLDDTALVYKSDEGLIIITGCSHSGICNICSYAKKVCNDHRIIDIIGGLHLQNPPKERLDYTIEFLDGLQLKRIHACHCTDLKSKIAIGSHIEMVEVGAGTVINYDS